MDSNGRLSDESSMITAPRRRSTTTPSAGEPKVSLLTVGLIDTLRLVIAPVVVGHQTTPGGLSVHSFERTGLPEYGTYGADA
jgi:hypothetical protein